MVRGVKFWDVWLNWALGTIRYIPHVLLADGIDINTANQNTIEKKLLDKVGGITLSACYRLLKEMNSEKVNDK